MDLDKVVRKYVLQNAIFYEGEANPGAVMGKVLGEHPELRDDPKQLNKVVRSVTEEVNSLSLDKQKKELEEIDPSMLEKGEKEEKTGLPELDNVDGDVVLRFAPNPNGPPTLGSSRGIVINSEYAKKYDGKFILRFDDTDPRTKKPIPEAYEWYEEDCKYLGAEPDEIYISSQRIDIYYKYAEKLIEAEMAYVCQCDADTFSELKKKGEACPHRNRDKKENKELWNRMIIGEFEEGEAVLTIKSELDNPNPALRDWHAFRIIKEDHPIVGDEYKVWPVLAFAGGIDDHLLGVTHIIRGKDLENIEYLQRRIYDEFGWDYPEVILWGRVNVQDFDVKMSTSKIKEGIESGKYNDWDDPRLPTVRALRRRGFTGEAIREFWIDVSITRKDLNITLDKLEKFNTRIIDSKAKRYFIVRDPKEIIVKNNNKKKTTAPLHPEEDIGEREIPVTDEIYIEKADFEKNKGKEIMLLRLYNINLDEESEMTDNKIKDNPKIHWVSNIHEKVKIMMPDGSEIEAFVEPDLTKSEIDDIIQGERFGFLRVDDKDPFVLYYAHR